MCPPHAETQAARCLRHCFIALSISCWSILSHSSELRCLSSVNSGNLASINPVLHDPPNQPDSDLGYSAVGGHRCGGIESGVSRLSKLTVSRALCAVLLKREVIRRWLLDIWQQVPHQECVTIALPINHDARVHKVKIRTAQRWHTDWCHDGMTEGRPRPCAHSKRSGATSFLRTLAATYNRSFCVLFGAATVHIFFIREQYEVHRGRRISLQQATSKSLAYWQRWARVRRLFRYCSYRSFLMIALTDATEIPIWREICLYVLMVCGAVSWLNAKLFSFSKNVQAASANGAQTTTRWMFHKICPKTSSNIWKTNISK